MAAAVYIRITAAKTAKCHGSLNDNMFLPRSAYNRLTARKRNDSVVQIFLAYLKKYKTRLIGGGLFVVTAALLLWYNGSHAGTMQVSGKMEDAPEMKKKIALTFDDGPNPDFTETLLDGLGERGVKATFFLLGSEVEKYPDIVKRIYEEGHKICTHSYEHVNLCNLSDAAAKEQVDKTNTAIYDITGEYPEYIRPPFGCWKSNLDYETKMIEVLWDIDPRDWATTNTAAVIERVVKKVQENDIILLHDASKSSVDAALAIVDELQKQGYVFVTVEEIVMD